MSRRSCKTIFVTIAGLVLIALACQVMGTSPLNPGLDEWVEGHYWTFKVKEVDTKKVLNGETPKRDIFVVVNVQWEANELKIKRVITGSDFQLIDADGIAYDLSGMIYDSDTFLPFSSEARYQANKWVIAEVSGDRTDTFRLVFDMPASAKGLKLWFQDCPKVDLALDLP